MPASDSLIWVTAVTVVIWAGIFVYCVGLDRRIRRLEGGE